MINIQIDDAFIEQVDAGLIEAAASKVLAYFQDTSPAELTIVMDQDDKIQELNKEYLGNDAPTDVLSFPSGGEIDPETGAQYLGDIMISFPYAQRQALSLGNSVKDEIQLLVIHGVLHLLGYDHLEDEDKAEMWQIQEALLTSLGCQISRLPE